LSAALKEIPRKRVGRGHLTTVNLRADAPTKSTVASKRKATRGEANQGLAPNEMMPLPDLFAPLSGGGDAAGQFARVAQTMHAGGEEFVDLDAVVDDLVRDGFDQSKRVTQHRVVEAAPSTRSARKSGGIDRSEVVTHARVVDPKRSVRKGGETGQAIHDTQSSLASLNPSSSDGGGIDQFDDAAHEQLVDPEPPVRKNGRTGHRSHVTQNVIASPETTASDGGEAGQSSNDAHGDAAGLNPSVSNDGGVDQGSVVSLRQSVDPNLIAAIQSLHREHRGLQNAVTGMTLRIKADERWHAASRLRAAGETLDGKKFPTTTEEDEEAILLMRPRYYSARSGVDALRKECQKELLAQAKQLPVVQWAESIRGFGLPSLAAIVGEAGDLSWYRNPAKLWKRFSLHVIGDKASKRIKGDKTQGFVPRRRAEMHVIGDNLVRSGGPYADLYRARKAYEIEKLAAQGIGVKPASQITEKNRDKFMSSGQVHKRALRYIEKRLLVELWRAWRDAEVVAFDTNERLAA
jgi:hypothetical protein